VGWSCTQGANLELGTCSLGFGYGGTAKKSNHKRYEDYGEKYGLNDVIGCGIDLGTAKGENATIWFSKNGKTLGKAFDVPKKFATGSCTFFPALCLKNAELECRFGGPTKIEKMGAQGGGGNKSKQIKFVKPLKHMPQGYTPIGEARRDQSASADDQEQQTISNSLNNSSNLNSSKPPMALILEPTRDLAEQTAKVVSDLCESLDFPKLSCTACIGGLNPKDQIKRLQKGCDVVVGTPARVLDFVQSGKLNLSKIKFYVLDEADRLVAEKDTREIVLKLYKRLPKQGLAGEDRLQCLLFSATLHSEEIKKIAGTICQNPIWVDLKGRDTVPETVHHVKYEVDPVEDRSWLQKLPHVNTDQVHSCHKECQDLKPNSSGKECLSQAVKLLKPRVLQRVIDGFQMDQCLIFCRTNFDCDQLESFLNELGGGRKFRGKVEKGLGKKQ
jgi:ATP-dependent RNA helicase DDX1